MSCNAFVIARFLVVRKVNHPLTRLNCPTMQHSFRATAQVLVRFCSTEKRTTFVATRYIRRALNTPETHFHRGFASDSAERAYSSAFEQKGKEEKEVKSSPNIFLVTLCIHVFIIELVVD